VDNRAKAALAVAVLAIGLAGAARAGSAKEADAAFNRGVMFEEGKGVPQDYAQAAFWYRKAAEQGAGYADTRLGRLYAAGKGVPQDYSTAAELYRMAANQWDPEGQVQLGLLYLVGRGVPNDIVQAYKWVEIATGLPSVIVQNHPADQLSRDDLNLKLALLNKIATFMSPDQIAEAKRQAQEWLKNSSPQFPTSE
jgi:TPR repeat protein